ncbi:MAG TPA: DUF192 domain-containing protein [Candidatus Binataceae bacterium]
MRIRVGPFALLVILLATFGCARGSSVSIVAHDGASRVQVAVEIADTGAQRETGLMYRTHLDERAGMLFVFSDASELHFWMKNTVIPLDMIFADARGRIIGIVANAEPYSETPVGVKGASEYVLEVNGGFCARHGVQPGDRFEFQGFTPHARE